MTETATEVHRTPLLEADASTGKPKFWQGFVVRHGSRVFTYTETRLGRDGKLKTSALTRVEGKNVGRANATTDEEQAVSEIRADEAKKRKKGYGEEGHVETFPVPMACQPIDKVPKFSWPAYSQPKLDGVRCVYNGDFAYSRGLEVFDPAFFERFAFPTDVPVDGELYVHGYSFQKIQSAIESYTTNELAPQIEYHLFDVITDAPFEERLHLLNDMRHRLPRDVKIVLTPFCEHRARADTLHQQWCEMGYEGSILRERYSPYEHKRSRHIVKLKDFVETEFMCVRYRAGKGKEADQIILTCATGDGQEFDVTPNDTIAARQAMLRLARERPELFIAQPYTVKHQGYYDSGIPRFPKGKAFRAKFDLPKV